jgi:hypothetical protein
VRDAVTYPLSLLGALLPERRRRGGRAGGRDRAGDEPGSERANPRETTDRPPAGPPV